MLIIAPVSSEKIKLFSINNASFNNRYFYYYIFGRKDIGIPITDNVSESLFAKIKGILGHQTTRAQLVYFIIKLNEVNKECKTHP